MAAVLHRPLSPEADRTQSQGRSPDLQIVAPRLAFPFPKKQWHLSGLLPAHSGGTAREFHPLPFSSALCSGHLRKVENTTLGQTPATRPDKPDPGGPGAP